MSGGVLIQRSITPAPAVGPVTPLFWDRQLFTLLDYWDSRRGNRPAPTRGDLDPCDIPRLLPSLHLIEVTEAPLRFRHRLVGTELVTVLGRDVTGRFVDADLYGRATDEIIETLAEVARTGRPHRRRARLDWHVFDWLTMETVELPLLDAGGRVAMILRGCSFKTGSPSLTSRLSYDPIAT